MWKWSNPLRGKEDRRDLRPWRGKGAASRGRRAATLWIGGLETAFPQGDAEGPCRHLPLKEAD